jgi:amino acid adenylation domain-containing protein
MIADLSQFPSPSLAARLIESARREPQRIAIAADGQEITYRQLEASAQRIAARLAAVTPASAGSQPVVVLTEHGPAAVIAIVGAILAGRCYAPLDARMPDAWLDAALRVVNPFCVITDAATRETARRRAPAAEIVLSEDAVPGSQSRSVPIELPDDAPGVLVLTSGSTGEPKAVVHSQRVLLEDAKRYCEASTLSKHDRVGLITRSSFAPSTFSIFGPLLTGASIHPYDLHTRGVAEFGAWLAAARISVIYTVPSVLRRITAQNGSTQGRSRMRLWHLGGEPVLASDLRRLHQHFPGVDLLQTMGSTETLFIAAQRVASHEDPPEGTVVAVGKPFADVNVRLENPDGTQVARGEVGELVVTSPRVARGYWRRPDLSAGRFTAAEDSTDLWTYRTGDLVRERPDGALVHVGRIDNQIKVNGVRVEPAQVQAVISELTGVREVFIRTVSLPSGNCRLIAYIVPSDPTTCDVAKLRAEAATRLPFAMLPTVFVAMDEFPTTSNGKVEGRALPDVALDESFYLDRGGNAEHDDVFLGSVVQAFERVLGSNVSPDSDFFALGGDSLRAIELFSIVNANFNANVSVSEILECPTPALLTERVARAVRSDLPPGVVRLSASAPTAAPVNLFCIPGLGVHVFYYRHIGAALGPGIDCYGLEFPGVDGVADPAGTIEELSATLMRSLLQTAPKGPVALLGYSVGGAIAFEMTRRLIEAGRQVELTALVDSYSPWAMRQLSLRRRALGWWRYATDASETARLTTLTRRPLEILASRVKRRSDDLALLNPGVEDPDGLVSQIQNAAVRRVARACRSAAGRYEPEPLPHDLVLFRAERRPPPPRGQLDLYDTWRTMTSGRVEEIVVPGAHWDMLVPPSAAIIAGILRARLALPPSLVTAPEPTQYSGARESDPAGDQSLRD